MRPAFGRGMVFAVVVLFLRHGSCGAGIALVRVPLIALPVAFFCAGNETSRCSFLLL